MAATDLVVRSRASSDSLRSAACALEDAVWEPMAFLSSTQAHQAHYERLLDTYADLQLCLVDEETGEPVALANCVPFHYGGELAALPREGWDWLVEAGSASQGRRCNLLGALAISVPADKRGRGLARRMIAELKALAVRGGYDALVGPVRPSEKSAHPLVPMTDYMHWRHENGAIYDPWIRSHSLGGATIINCCDRSMVVSEHLAFWETWAGRRFERSGRHILPNALVPITVDLERQTGVYEEPNVWMGYRL